MPDDVRGQSRKEREPEPVRKEPAVGPEAPSPARVDYRFANLRGCDMRGLSLEHADFRAGELQDVNFSGCNLRYSDFRGANVERANFQGASLYGAKMQGVVAFNADFRNSDLRQANFGGAYLDKAMMPPLERRASPGEIAGQAEQDAETMRQKLTVKRSSDLDGNAGNDRNGQAHGRSRPGERQDKGRGR